MNTLLLLSFIFFISALFTMKYKEKKPKRLFLDASLFFFFGFITILYFIANYFTGKGINETVLATLNLGVQDGGFDEYLLLIAISFLSFVLLFVAAFFYYRNLKSVAIAKPQKIKAFLHNGFLILAFAAHPAILDIKNLYQNITIEQSDDFYEYYKTPDTLNLNSNKKNIIFIYAESLERTYFDNKLFPNLMSNLSEIIKKEGAVEFTNISQTVGSNYTIAGMTSTQCAIPLFTTSSGNSMEGVDKFYPKAICLGDVLKKDNYYLSVIQGSSTKFSGIDKFYKTHSFDKLQGKEELQKSLANKRYINGWGLYDDSVLESAWNEFKALSSLQKHFALFIHTLDTHHPNGHLSKSCSKDLYNDGSNEILNCVKCSDMLISNFIKKVRSSEYSKNTIIILTSDHLAMRNTASDELDKSTNRRNLFVVLDPDNKEYKAIDKAGTPLDFSSTALSFLDIKTDFGLGRNLREQESISTLFNDFDKKLNSWREDILSFWQFAKISDNIKIDSKKMAVSIEDSSYKIPVLFRLLTNNVEPYFEFNYSWKLYQQLENFEKEDRFLWVDKCSVINYIFKSDIKQKYCVAEGVLGKTYKAAGVDKIKEYKLGDFTQYDINITMESLLSNIDMIKRNGVEYMASLKNPILFKKEGHPSFLEDIKGVSYPEKLGRWTDEWLNPTAKFIFKEPLAKNLKLEIVCKAHEKSSENIVKVKIADSVQEFKADSKIAKKYTLYFKNIQNEKVIEIIPPKPYEPKNTLEGEDIRKVGLLLIELKVTAQ